MRLRVIALVLVLSMVLVSSVGLADETSDKQAPDGMKWDVDLAYAQAYLTVTGPDNLRFERAYGSDEALYLSIYDGEGNALPDGGYKYEWTFAPVLTPEVEGLMRDAGEKVRAQLAADLQASGALPESMPSVTGAFSISGGALVADSEEVGGSAPSELTGATLDDVVHNDDVIVDGSLCVGFDCNNGESFGFDTLKLKENNLRIYFHDTSNTASFPTTDWRLTANDSSNGGQNRFSIEDASANRQIFTVEANAPSHSLYVEDSGQVGLGTNSPVVQAHIKYCNTPTVRLDQDSSCGWSSQAWDVAGNEANFFIRDVTNGSRLFFRVQPGAPTNALTIKSDGNIGMGTWSPAAPLEIERTGSNPRIYLQRTDGAEAKFVVGSSSCEIGSVSDHEVAFIQNSVRMMSIDVDGSVTVENDLTVNGTIYRSDGTIVGGLAGTAAGDAALEAKVEAQEELIAELLLRIEALEAQLNAPDRADR